MSVNTFHDTPAVEHALRLYHQLRMPVPDPEPDVPLPPPTVSTMHASIQKETLSLAEGRESQQVTVAPFDLSPGDGRSEADMLCQLMAPPSLTV